MASKNPNPARVSDALWGLWTDFKAFEAKALFGGILALKPGYHSYRDRLSSSDYSVSDVAADRKGSGSKASALDITLPKAEMIKYSKRLDAAMRARDKRLFIDGVPILREFIGTLNGTTVYCYVLVGGKQLGVGADSGTDPGRSKTHLWHIHLSLTRQFCESFAAMERILSILKGEAYTAWAARHGIGVTPKPPAPKPPAKPAPAKPASHKPGSRDLKQGMSGEDVRFVQKFIGPKRSGAADGKAGPKFTAAVRWYQGMRGLKADGIVGDKTWRAMGVKPS